MHAFVRNLVYVALESQSRQLAGLQARLARLEQRP